MALERNLTVDHLQNFFLTHDLCFDRGRRYKYTVYGHFTPLNNLKRNYLASKILVKSP